MSCPKAILRQDHVKLAAQTAISHTASRLINEPLMLMQCSLPQPGSSIVILFRTVNLFRTYLGSAPDIPESDFYTGTCEFLFARNLYLCALSFYDIFSNFFRILIRVTFQSVPQYQNEGPYRRPYGRLRFGRPQKLSL